ncbi:MAG: hypothetical protein VX836_19535 [Pseudomonadota bacterium]|nr:hypothetical protein [Pseudomonadota bacterium]
MTQRIRLPALIGSNPLAALTAFGLLRLLYNTDPSVRLGFVLEDDWIAFIESDRFESIEDVLELTSAWVQTDTLDRLLGWANDVRVAPEEYRSLVKQANADSDFELLSFLSAIAADGAVDTQKGRIKPSAFYMVSGQQSFLGGTREILSAVRQNSIPLLAEALVGPWSYQTRLHSLGWDPATERLYALRHKAPTSEKPSCIAGAVLLAAWSLSLFPTNSERGRALTTGFRREGRDQHFEWPIFSQAIDLPELKSLLHTAAWTTRSGTLRGGIDAIYSARRSEFGQGYAVFRQARLVGPSA